MAIITVLPQGTYAPGTRTLGPASIATGLTNAVLALDGIAMTDPALNVSMTIDFSLDGGATWAAENPGPATNPYPVTMTLVGGSHDKHGLPVAVYDLQAILPSPASTTRRARGTLVISGASLTTTGTLTLI